MDEGRESGEHRALAVGVRIAARPCLVTITRVVHGVAWGHCATCRGLHVIDHARYERGDGPWRPSHDASACSLCDGKGGPDGAPCRVCRRKAAQDNASRGQQ